MCASAISYARIERIYYGASDEKFGAIEHGARIFDSMPVMFKPDIYGGLMEQECADLLQEYFRSLRVRCANF